MGDAVAGVGAAEPRTRESPSPRERVGPTSPRTLTFSRSTSTWPSAPVLYPNTTGRNRRKTWARDFVTGVPVNPGPSVLAGTGLARQGNRESHLHREGGVRGWDSGRTGEREICVDLRGRGWLIGGDLVNSMYLWPLAKSLPTNKVTSSLR